MEKVTTPVLAWKALGLIEEEGLLFSYFGFDNYNNRYLVTLWYGRELAARHIHTDSMDKLSFIKCFTFHHRNCRNPYATYNYTYDLKTPPARVYSTSESSNKRMRHGYECGIYGYRGSTPRYEKVFSNSPLYGDIPTKQAIVVFSMRGVVLECGEGYRAQYARIEEIHLSHIYQIPAYKNVIDKITSRYGVRIVYVR